MEMADAAELDNKVYYATDEPALITAELLSADPFISMQWNQKSNTHTISVNLTGAYNFENILSAICIATFFEVGPEQIHLGIAGYLPNNNRSQITKTAHNTVICDFYNANPSSMSAALTNISVLSASQKAIIIGDMFELGAESAAQHELIAQQAAQLDAGTLIFIGKDFYPSKHTYKGNFFITREEAADFLKAHPLKDMLILLKGSRGMALEKLLPLL